ncbi:MAG: DNA polymerase Y family protein [Alphaproteobacteria bacterium]|nr:DNA polymerase Y family protein [Alphaproteobacteria bacterium]
MAFPETAKERRILALWLPRLSTDRIRRKQASGAGPETPLVVVGRIRNALRLCAIDEQASRLSLKTGMPLADARAMVPSLRAIEADEAADRELLQSIASWCDRFTPFVALDQGGLLLDVTGTAHLFGGEKPMLDRICALLRKQGFSVEGAIAGSAAAARALSRYAAGTVVESPAQIAALAPLPVEALALDPVSTHAFRRAGLKTVGQVFSRSRAELASRFGTGMLSALDQGMGLSEAPISPRRVLPAFTAELNFPDPVSTQAVISDSLLALAQSLCRMLLERGQGARTLEASFFRADGVTRSIRIDTARPLRDAAMLVRLFHERLDALADPLDPGFGFDLIRLEVTHAEREEDQGARVQDAAEKELSFLIDRLAARFGASRILCFHAQDTHIPEAAAVAVPAQRGFAQTSWQERGTAPPPRPLRLFQAPELIEVTAAVPDGPPAQFRWREVLHAVARAEGPERIAMEWWRNASHHPTRDYFRIEDESGKRFWLFREGLFGRETLNPRWYLHGLFA